MASESDVNRLYDHYEKYLGEQAFTFRLKDEGKPPFVIFGYRPSMPEGLVQLVTFGMFTHRLQVRPDDRIVRTELALFAKSTASEQSLYAVLASVGRDILERHESPGVHGIISSRGGPVRLGGNSLFQSFYLRPPVGLLKEFGACSLESSTIEILQIIPISLMEEHLIRCSGWQVFEERIVAGKIDFLEFDERAQLSFD
jgi:hypothetical protein